MSVRRIEFALWLVALLPCAACGLRPQASPDTDSVSSATPFELQTIARDLETPWAMAASADGRLFVTERLGRIRVIVSDSLLPTPWATVAVHESAAENIETGLMGLALDPQFVDNGRLYICYTIATAGALTNRIAVLTEQAGQDTALRSLIEGIPAGRYHNGCRLKFGPDGKLYATTGDAGESRDQGGAAQDMTSLAGKVLRLNSDGSIPGDNPFPGSYVWTLGHRNAQGLAWQPGTNRLFATEHGTGGTGNNEVNILAAGGNFGWPIVIGDVADPRFVRPIFVGTDAPAGATFVVGSRYPALQGSLLIATLSARRLLELKVSDPVPATTVLIDTTLGRLRDVIQGPDGMLYLATSNRDGRGRPGPEDDRILRLVPKP